MKLAKGTKFTSFSCPALKLELGAGHILAFDKDTIAVQVMDVAYIVERSVPYLLTINIGIPKHQNPIVKGW